MLKQIWVSSDLEISQSETFTKYSKLLGGLDYDYEAVDQLAEALNEIEIKSREISVLEQLVLENKELSQFVWRTAAGVTLAIHNMDNDHISNAMLNLMRHGNAIPRALRSEAIKRNITIPVGVPIDWEDREIFDWEDREI